MTKHLTLNAQPTPTARRAFASPLPLLRAEALKLKGNGLGLTLLLLAPALVGVAFLLKDVGGDNVKVDVSGMDKAWAAPLLMMPVFFLPYLLTMEETVGTAKWLKITPTRPWKIVLAKIATAFLLSLALSGLGLLLFGGSVTLPAFGTLLATVLTSTLVFTLLSLLLRNFAAVVVLTFVWTTVAPMLMAFLPAHLREPFAAALPGLNFNHWGGDFQGVRIAATTAYAALTVWLLRKQRPEW